MDERKKYKIELINGKEILADNFEERGIFFIAINYLENDLRDLIMIKREDISLFYVRNVSEEEFHEITDISQASKDPDPDDCDNEEIITHEVPKQYISLDVNEIMYN